MISVKLSVDYTINSMLIRIFPIGTIHIFTYLLQLKKGAASFVINNNLSSGCYTNHVADSILQRVYIFLFNLKLTLPSLLHTVLCSLLLLSVANYRLFLCIVVQGQRRHNKIKKQSGMRTAIIYYTMPYYCFTKGLVRVTLPASLICR